MSCETEIQVVKGQDCDLQITLRDQNGNIINGTSWKIITVITHANGTEIVRYSKNAAVGYKTMDISNQVNGIVSVKLLTAHTMASAPGKLYQETHIQISDAASTDDSVLDYIAPKKYCCTIINSSTGGLILP